MHDTPYTIFGVDPDTNAMIEVPARTLDEAVDCFVKYNHPEHAAKVWSKAKKGFLLHSFLRSYAFLRAEGHL